MPRKGRFLEILVKYLQEFLGPEGIAATSPEEFYDEYGNKIGEIDVTLRGDFGSSKIFVGIECRDQPSHGPQGRGWIREIIGKRDDLNVDKMIAVSTTRFTQPAIDLANSSRVDLLTIESKDESDVNHNLRNWFETLTFVWVEDSYEISGVVDITTIPRTSRSDTHGSILIKDRISGMFITLQQYIKPKLDSLFTSMQVDPNTIREIETLIELNEQVDAMFDNRLLKIARMRIPLKLQRETIKQKVLVNVCKRLGDDEIIALTGVCRIETKHRKLKVLVTAKKSITGEGKIDLKCDLLNEENEPYPMPAGTRVALYGSKKPI